MCSPHHQGRITAVLEDGDRASCSKNFGLGCELMWLAGQGYFITFIRCEDFNRVL
jgi:hypothetical protein